MKMVKVKTNFGENLFVNDKTTKLFKREQEEFGTKVALGNLMWSIGAKFMNYAGVRNIKTTYNKVK